MVEKSPNAFRNISEVSAMLDIPTHVLRFWETRFSQIKPVKRSGGRRYYRPDDIELLQRIRGLLYDEGYTIKGAKQVLDTSAADTSAADTSVSDTSVSDTSAADTSAVDTSVPDGDSDTATITQALGLLKQASTRLAHL